jgi:plastocyanin
MQPSTNTAPTQPAPAMPAMPEPSPKRPRMSKRKRFIGIALLVVITIAAVTALVLYLQNMALDNESQQSAPNAEVNIQPRNGFTPATVKVKKGQTVVWTNNDSQPHKLSITTANAPEGFGTDDPLNAGETYSFTFEADGTYTYNDPLNPLGTNGTVIVEN